MLTFLYLCRQFECAYEMYYQQPIQPDVTQLTSMDEKLVFQPEQTLSSIDVTSHTPYDYSTSIAVTKTSSSSTQLTSRVSTSLYSEHTPSASLLTSLKWPGTLFFNQIWKKSQGRSRISTWIDPHIAYIENPVDPYWSLHCRGYRYSLL